MKVDGSCHCGKITFEAEIDPEKVGICHCTDCQSLSGTAFRVSAPMDEKDFRLLSGTPKQYIKTAESGAQRIQAFCGDCGSPIYATAAATEGDPKFGIRVGVLKQRAQLPPKRQVWCQSQLPWLPELPGVTRERQ